MKNPQIICQGCGSKYVWVKKWRLCVACYQTACKNNFKDYAHDPPVKEVDHDKEITFIQNYFRERTNWVYHPAVFKIKSKKGYTKKYTPDFYDGDRKVFIEVSGSRQAFHQNKNKYKEFKMLYPDIKLEFYTSVGELIKLEEERQPDGTWDYNKK